MEGASLHASLIGATIGNYRVVAKLGEGGMGAVYLAEHPQIGKKVALKVLHEEYSANQDVITRFFNEAKAVNDISHPNIVDIIDYGVVQTPTGPGFVYFIMEFLAGESLAALLQREAPLPPERALHIGIQVADALAASHAKGIVHRDLKPDNIYLLQRARERDFVKVLDFGIAKLTGDQAGSRRTRTGIVMGTPAYMSPEQCEGRGNIDHRTDIYAMGILLYEMVTGRVPFAGEGYGEVLVQHLTKAPARPSTVRGLIPPAIEAIIMKALEKSPANRYQNMDQFMNAMRDPEGFIAANGGMDAFMASAPTSSNMPTMPLTAGSMDVAMAPRMSNAYQSQPGTQNQATAFLSQPGGRPTTLTSSAGQVVSGGSRVPVIAVSATLVLLLLAGGAYVLFGRKGNGGTVAATDKPTVEEVAKPTDSTNPPGPTTPVANPATSAPVVTAGSSAAAVQPATSAPAVAVTSSAAAPQPETPKVVSISLTSMPAGAEVFVAGESAPRGKTPIKFELPRGDSETELTFKLPGYKDKIKKVKLSSDSDSEVALEKIVVVSRPDVRRPADVKKPVDVKKPDEVKKPPVETKKPKVDEDDVLPPSF